jgi:hypothetical protein
MSNLLPPTTPSATRSSAYPNTLGILGAWSRLANGISQAERP